MKTNTRNKCVNTPPVQKLKNVSAKQHYVCWDCGTLIPKGTAFVSLHQKRKKAIILCLQCSESREGKNKKLCGGEKRENGFPTTD